MLLGGFLGFYLYVLAMPAFCQIVRATIVAIVGTAGRVVFLLFVLRYAKRAI